MLLVFGFGCYLLGRPVIRLFLAGDLPAGAERHLLTMATGAASAMILVAALGTVGLINRASVAGLFVAALLANVVMTLADRRVGGLHPRLAARTRESTARPRTGVGRNAGTVVAVGLLAAPLLLSAVTGTLGGDSYIYHLPQARLIAESGRLAVSEHLQVPLHPHYYHLLYAVALLVWDDRLANAIHAASAVLSVLGLYYFGRIWAGRAAAFLACAAYVAFVACIDSAPAVAVSAYVGYGTAVFTPFAYHCLGRALAWRSPRMLCLACLLIGVSLGTKTQAWVGIPAFALLGLFAAWKIRRVRPMLVAVPLAVVTGGFWYARNFLISGDPFHPLGGNWFGHWAWDAGDLAAMHDYIRARTGLNPLQWLLVAPALCMPLLARRLGGFAYGAALASVAGLATWIATSFHDRFLLSIAPVVLLTSASVVCTVCRNGTRVAPFLARRHGAFAVGEAGNVGKVAVVALCGAWAVALGWFVGTFNESRCGALLCVAVVEGIEPARFLDQFPRDERLKLYQYGLGHAYWYLGNDVAGGWTGPSRHRDLDALGGDGDAIAAHLKSLGRNALLLDVDAQRHAWPLTDSFLERFAPCGGHGRVALFVLRDALAENWPPPGCDGAPAVPHPEAPSSDLGQRQAPYFMMQ